MYSMDDIREYAAKYDGYQLQGYLLKNIDLIGYIATFYLVFIGKGKPILRWLCGRRQCADKKYTPYSLAALNRLFAVSCMYHIAVSLLALACTMNLLPTLLRAFEQQQAYVTLCAWNDNLIYSGAMGFWVSVCVFAKIADLIDSCLLVVRDWMVSEMSSEVRVYVGSMRQITATHWWFRTLIALLWWQTFSIGISTLPTLVLVDAACHVIIHAAHFGADLLSFVPAAVTKSHGQTPSAPVLLKLLNAVSTLALLAECVACTSVILYSGYMNYTAPDGCHVIQANVRMALTVFVGTIGFAVARLCAAKNDAREPAAEANGSSKAHSNGKHDATPIKNKKKQ